MACAGGKSKTHRRCKKAGLSRWAWHVLSCWRIWSGSMSGKVASYSVCIIFLLRERVLFGFLMGFEQNRVLSKGAQANLGSAPIDLFLILDGAWFQLALFIGTKLCSIELWTAITNTHPILQVGDILHMYLLCRLRLHKCKTHALKFSIVISMLYKQPCLA